MVSTTCGAFPFSDVISTKLGAFPFSTLHWQNEVIRALTNECAPRHHHDGGTTSPHHHSFDHILCCTGPILSKLKPLERTWDTTYAAKNKIPNIIAYTNRSQCALVPNPKLMLSTTCSAFPFSTIQSVSDRLLALPTKWAVETVSVAHPPHRTNTDMNSALAALLRFSINWNHRHRHDIPHIPHTTRIRQ